MDLTNPGIEPGSPALQVDSLPTGLLGKSKNYFTFYYLLACEEANSYF